MDAVEVRLKGVDSGRDRLSLYAPRHHDEATLEIDGLKPFPCDPPIVELIRSINQLDFVERTTECCAGRVMDCEGIIPPELHGMVGILFRVDEGSIERILQFEKELLGLKVNFQISGNTYLRGYIVPTLNLAHELAQNIEGQTVQEQSPAQFLNMRFEKGAHSDYSLMFNGTLPQTEIEHYEILDIMWEEISKIVQKFAQQ